MADVPVNPSDANTIVVVTSNGQTVFNYDFRADFADDMRAIYHGAAGDVALVGGVDFTVSGLGTAAGGTITLVSFTATVLNEEMTIYRYIEIDRTTDYIQNLFAADLNAEQDRIFMIAQELRRDIDRAVKAPIGEDPIDVTVGTPGQILVFDADGDLVPQDASTSGVSGNMFKAVYDPQGINADAFDLGNMTGRLDGNANLPAVATATIKGRSSSGSGNSEDLTPLQTRDLLNPLRSFNADGSTDDSANFAALEASVTGQKIDGRGKRYRVTGDIPSGNQYTNGFWVIANYEGGLTADIPFDFASLPFKKTTIDAAPGHNSWTEDNFSYSEGERVGSFTTSAHGSGGRFVGKSISGSLDYWRKSVPDFGRDQNDAANGFYKNGGVVMNGAEFQLMRRQAAGGGQPTDHRIYARNRQRRREVTDVITPRDTLTSFRVYKTDVDFEVLEGTKATIIATSAVGGQTINGEYTCLANNNLFMEFSAVAGAFVGTTKGGGFTQFVINESGFTERTFAAGASLGEQLVINTGDDGLLTFQPAVVLGMAPIPSDLAGGAYTTAGGSYGIYVVKISGLFAGNNECTLPMVKKIASWATYGEPCLAVSKVNENMVVVGLRSDSSSQPPAFAVTLDAFSTISAPIPLSATGNWGLDNNIPVASMLDVDGNEHFFLALTGNRGGDGDASGWTRLPVYIAHATRADIITAATSGVSPFKIYAVGSVDFVDMFSDSGGSGRSGVGVGSLMALPGGVLNYICGDMQRYSKDGGPRCHIASFKFDVSRFLGLPPADISEDADCASDTLVCWQGLSGSAIGPNSDYVPVNYVVETVEDGMSTAGVFTPKETGWYELIVNAQLNGNGSEQTIVVHDVATGAILAQPAHTGDLNSTIDVIRATLPVGLNMTVMGYGLFYLIGGQSVKLRTGANTTVQNTATSNFIRWKRVA